VDSTPNLGDGHSEKVDREDVMPSSSKAQHNFMAAIAHSPSFAKKVGVPMSVGKDFTAADKGRKFSKGGDMATKGVNPFAKFEKSGKDVEKKGMKEGSKADMALDKKQMMGMKRGGSVKKMAEGGMTDMEQDKAMIKKAFKQHDMQEHKGGKGTDLKLAKGGFARLAGGKLPSGSMSFKGTKGSSVKSGLDAGNKSADGIAQRGKTRGDNIVMKSRGGKC